MNWTPNEKQNKVIAYLKANQGHAFTLAEISKAIEVELKTGTTNTLVAKGVIKCNKNALELVCPTCGHKHKVSTYEIA